MKRTPTPHSPLSDPPTLRWLYASPLRCLAFGFGVGLVRPGPGTWGTVLAWLLWVGLERLPAFGLLFFLCVSFILGAWACQVSGQALGKPDHSGMVWDEMVAFWWVLWLVPATLPSQALAFLLFRVFDILKPPPIAQFDQRWKNGVGVMADDVLAGAYTVSVVGGLAWLGLWQT